MLRLIPILAFGLAALAAADSPAEPYAPQAGRQHADLTLPRITDGEPVSLSDFRGRKVLLIQFASW